MKIVISAYNRSESLDRLLSSLNNSFYDSAVELIIDIDFSDNKNVYNTAEKFEWKHGEKKIILQKKNMGLREHILNCFDYVNSEEIILLEDDLYVSRNFFLYAKSAAEFYYNKTEIAAISLYHQPYHALCGLPFQPLDDGYENYFMQYPSSSGFVINSEQWKNFKTWLNENKFTVNSDFPMPQKIKNWEASSWKKLFAAYLVESETFVVYPRISLTTNFGDSGTHHSEKSKYFQSQLLFSENKNLQFNFSDLSESKSIYDLWMEYVIPLSDAEFDLYALKEKKYIKTKNVYTIRDVKTKIKSFGRELKPAEMNVLSNIPGNDIHLTETSHLPDVQKNNFAFVKKQWEYFYTIFSARDAAKYFLKKLF